MNAIAAPTVSVSRPGRTSVIDIEITAATAHQAREAFSAFAGSPAVLESAVLREPHATSDGFVLFGRATLIG
jgi:hypothetical protein